MKLEIVTPERRLDEVEASEVVAPGQTGEFGVLAGHKPFLTCLGTGVMTYQSSGQRQALMVSGGLCEVLEDRISVLAEYAVPVGEIDAADARRQVAELEKQLDALPADHASLPKLAARLARWRAQIDATNSR